MKISVLGLGLFLGACLPLARAFAQDQDSPPDQEGAAPQPAPTQGGDVMPRDDENAPQEDATAQPGRRPKPRRIDIVPRESYPGAGLSQQEDAPPPPNQETGEMRLEDARPNFQSILEAFIAARSRNGYWPLREKTTKQVLRLKLQSIDLKDLRQEEKSVFTAPALLLDVKNARRVPVEFSIDFSGTQWHVTRMRMLKAPSKSPEGADEEEPE